MRFDEGNGRRADGLGLYNVWFASFLPRESSRISRSMGDRTTVVCHGWFGAVRCLPRGGPRTFRFVQNTTECQKYIAPWARRPIIMPYVEIDDVLASDNGNALLLGVLHISYHFLVTFSCYL